MNLTTVPPTRKQRFNAALQLAGMTLKQWCAENGVSRIHLHEGFKGNREFGAALSAKIDEFTETHLAKVA
jgi:hypothetical protein